MNTLEHNFKMALSAFDLEEAHSVMNFLKWTWGNSLETPSKEEIRRHIVRLFESLHEEDLNEDNAFDSIESGGFRVAIFISKGVKIEFVVTESESGFNYE